MNVFSFKSYIRHFWKRQTRNMCMCICTLWIYLLSTLENTDENKIFFVRSPQAFWLSSAPGVLSTLVISVVFYSLTWATLMSPGQDKTHVCVYMCVCVSIYIYIYTYIHTYLYNCGKNLRIDSNKQYIFKILTRKTMICDN